MAGTNSQRHGLQAKSMHLNRLETLRFRDGQYKAPCWGAWPEPTHKGTVCKQKARTLTVSKPWDFETVNYFAGFIVPAQFYWLEAASLGDLMRVRLRHGKALRGRTSQETFKFCHLQTPPPLPGTRQELSPQTGVSESLGA